MSDGSNLLQQMEVGGPVMWVLLAGSILAVAVALERAITIHRSRTDTASLLKKLRKLLRGERSAQNAMAVCREAKGSVARVLTAGVAKMGARRERLEETLEVAALHEIGRLEKGLGLLATIAHLAPLLGFLGTVTGMIVSFELLGSLDTARPSVIAIGIKEALTTTAAGLIVAIPTQLVYNVLSGRVSERVREIEVAAHSLLEMIEPDA